MNTLTGLLRRLLMILGLVLAIVIVTVLLVLPGAIVDFATQVRDSPASTRTLMLAVAVLIDAVLLYMAYRLIRPTRQEMLYVRARGARTELSVDSAIRQIDTRIAQVSDVVHVHAEVDVEKGNAHVTLNVRARPDITIPEKQKELARVLRQLVEKQMGVRLASEPLIHLALATDEYSSSDMMTTVVEPMDDTYTTISEAQYTDAAPHQLAARPANALPAPQPARSQDDMEGSTISERQKEDEPWREFLLGDDA